MSFRHASVRRINQLVSMRSDSPPSGGFSTATNSVQGAGHAVVRTLYSRAHRIGLDGASCLSLGLCKDASFDLLIFVSARKLSEGERNSSVLRYKATQGNAQRSMSLKPVPKVVVNGYDTSACPEKGALRDSDLSISRKQTRDQLPVRTGQANFLGQKSPTRK